MKKTNFVIGIIISIICINVLSCSKQAENKPLKETQIYGSANHLPARKLLSFLPQPDALALISPSIKNIVYSFFRINDFRNNEIMKYLKNDPTISLIIKEDKEKTLENFKSLGIDIDQPCAFFYTLDDKWEAVLVGENISAFQKILPNAKKTTLKTSWFWFISGKLSAYWDNNSNVGFTTHNGHTILSNNIELLTKSISGNTPPPSFHYGLNGKPVLSTDEIAVLLSISDDLIAMLNNPKKPFEPAWLKAVLLSLESDYNEVCTIINPEDTSHEIAVAFHSKQNPNENIKLPELKLSNFLPENSLLKFNLAITNGLRNVLMQLPRNDSSGQIKKSLGPAINLLNSPIFQNELSIGVLPNNEKLPNVILITMSSQVDTLKSLLTIASVPDEPIGEFEVLRADLQKLAKLPIVLYIGLKNPYIIITDNREQLAEITGKFSLPPQEGTSQNNCPYGFIINDTNAIDTFINNNPDVLKTEEIKDLVKVLHNIPEACMYNDDSWYLFKAKVTI